MQEGVAGAEELFAEAHSADAEAPFAERAERNAEMICADFLAGANLEVGGSSDSLLLALSRIYLLLPNSQLQEFLLRIPKAS